MATTTEPIKDRGSIACLLCSAALVILGLPWYGESYSGCTTESYKDWARTGEEVDGCHGPDLALGVPSWAFGLMCCWITGCLLIVVAVCRWKVVDKESSLGDMAMVFAPQDA